MCTVSWLRTPAGYHVFFNRDEHVSRAPESAPEEAVLGQVHWLGPRDGDHHGTWIGVNQHGITFGLLNRWDDVPELGAAYTSRGTLVASLMNLKTLTTLPARLPHDGLARYRPFALVAVAPGSDAQVITWDGRTVSIGQQARSGLIATSSGHDQVAAAAARSRLFVEPEGGWTAEMLTALHRSHHPERGALSPCMHRSDASTVSFTVVVVEGETIRMEYTPGAPCTGNATTYSIDRRR